MMTDDQIFLHLDKLVAYRGCTSKTAQTAKELNWRGLPRKQARLAYRRELVCQEGVIGVSDNMNWSTAEFRAKQLIRNQNATGGAKRCKPLGNVTNPGCRLSESCPWTLFE